MNKCKCTPVDQKNPDLLPREAVEAPEPKRPPGAKFNIVWAKMCWLNKLSKNIINMTKQKISREGQLKCSVYSRHCTRPLKQINVKQFSCSSLSEDSQSGGVPAQQGLPRAWESYQPHPLNKIPLLSEAGAEMQWCWWKWAQLSPPVSLGGLAALLA